MYNILEKGCSILLLFKAVTLRTKKQTQNSKLVPEPPSWPVTFTPGWLLQTSIPVLQVCFNSSPSDLKSRQPVLVDCHNQKTQIRIQTLPLWNYLILSKYLILLSLNFRLWPPTWNITLYWPNKWMKILHYKNLTSSKSITNYL